ncbi:glycoside hydrolase family 16 protein [Aeromicrobium sp. NPDC092404]|uniref:glycoside hydrolase family 16 protein n=1 Tax=Aeromicrobium sp. NPDC092404 TaxID=3154976 RepID=UPI00342068ED
MRSRPGVRLAVALVALSALLTGCSDSGPEDRSGPDCGDAIDKPGGGRWTCTFVDDFRGNRLDPDKWLIQSTATSGFRNNRECYGGADNVKVGGGVLSLTVRHEPAPFVCQDPTGPFTTQYTGGMVTTWERFSQTYGRFEIRARMPDVAVAGIHSAIWLWPQDVAKRGGKPMAGEIDIAEYYTAYDDRLIPYIHYVPVAEDRTMTNNHCLVDEPSRWHTYLLEWTPKKLTIWYDDEKCLQHSWNPAPPLTKPAPFDQPFIIALTQSLGVPTTANEPTPATPLPATMQVDRVRVWK